jgi:hypothetical protein
MVFQTVVNVLPLLRQALVTGSGIDKKNRNMKMVHFTQEIIYKPYLLIRNIAGTLYKYCLVSASFFTISPFLFKYKKI